MKDPELDPVIDVRIGAKRLKAVYADTGLTRTVDTPDGERNQRVLDDAEIRTLAGWAAAVEEHYGCPMDIEWAKDGLTGELWIVQARPETVQSRRRTTTLTRRRLTAGPGEPLVEGIAVGEAIGQGRVVALDVPVDLDRFPQGGVLVTGVTDPDWEPVMKRASAIVTDHGGRTSHAAIVSRELGVPAVVGTGNGTRILRDGHSVTVSCAEGGSGRVYPGLLPYEETQTDLAELPATRTRVMLNLADPSAAFRWWRLPADGVGLARLEFIVAHQVKVHPMALLHPERLDAPDRHVIERLAEGYLDRGDYFVDRLAHGIARIAASRWPAPVVVRTSDFKTNEYAKLLGGRPFEPDEANPMIGWRGASRYYSDGYREGFALECRALRRVRDGMGLTNVIVMIPFCRTLGEADRVLAVMADEGLVRGENGLQVYVMAEIPANIILARSSRNASTDSRSAATTSPSSPSASTATPRPSPMSSTSGTPRSSAAFRPSPSAPTRRAGRSGCVGRGRATIRRSPRSWSRRASTRSRWRRTASQRSKGTWPARRRRARTPPDEGRSDRAEEDTPARRRGHRVSLAPGSHHQGVDALRLNQRRIGRMVSRGAKGGRGHDDRKGDHALRCELRAGEREPRGRRTPHERTGRRRAAHLRA